MNIDRILNIYQSYSLTKISAINKQMLIAQYAQCENIKAVKNNWTSPILYQDIYWKINLRKLNNEKLKNITRTWHSK